MRTEDFLLSAMAEIGAMRRLLVQALALRLMDDAAPFQTLELIGGLLAASPTTPAPGGSTLDPALSDMLAALTDEHALSLVADVRARLTALTG
jgi:hypothetical protein